MSAISVNAGARPLVQRLINEADALRIKVTRGELGETRIDAGSESLGGIEAGLIIAEICMGGLGRVRINPNQAIPNWPWSVIARSSQPLIACLGSQYAGWSLSDKDAGGEFFALGSGPARALAQKEKIFEDIGYTDRADFGTLVLESEHPPPPAIVAKVARDCRLKTDALTFIHAPTRSLAGSVQIAARTLEVALHKAHALQYPCERIVDGMGACPLPPPHPKFNRAMGRTNDAIIYAGRVALYVTGSASDAEALARKLPSQTSHHYGQPFAELFESVKGDFYAIDPMLFSPAEIIVTAIENGQTFHHGRIDLDRLDASFR